MTAASSDEREILRAAEVIKLGVLTISSERDGDVHTVELEGEQSVAVGQQAGFPPVQPGHTNAMAHASGSHDVVRR
jgi:hypothetical protein